MNPLPSDEKYLLCIYEIQAKPNELISTGAIAERLGVKSASVTEMLIKLSQKDYVEYLKSNGSILTNTGRSIAVQVLRRELLWEMLLVEKLKLGAEETSRVISELRHISSEELIIGLNDFLSKPLYGVNGRPIPTACGSLDHALGVALSSANVSFIGKVVGFKDNSLDFMAFLSKKNIKISTKVCVIDICSFDKSVEISIDENSIATTLSNKVAENILVV